MQGLRRLGEGLDRDQGLDHDRLRATRPAAPQRGPRLEPDRRPRPRPAPARDGRRRSPRRRLAAYALSAPARPARRSPGRARSAGSVIAYLGSLASCSSTRSGTRPVHRRRSSPSHARQLRDARSTSPSTGRSPSGRSSWRPPSPSPASSSRSRSPTTWPGSPRRGPRGPGRRGPHPALGELPHQGLRLAADPRRGRHPQLVPRAVRLKGPGYGEVAVWLVFTLPLAAVHDPADLRRPGADPVLAARGVGGPGRPRRGTTFRRVVLPLACRRSWRARSSRSR